MLGYIYKGHQCIMIKSLIPNKYSIHWAVGIFRGGVLFVDFLSTIITVPRAGRVTDHFDEVLSR